MNEYALYGRVDQIPKTSLAVPQRLFCPGFVRLQIESLEYTIESGEKIFRVKGFAQIVIGAQMQCLDSALRGGEGSHHHASHPGIRLLQSPHQSDAASGSQPHIDQRDVRGKAGDGPPGGACFVHRKNLESLHHQEVGGAVGEVAIVIDDENPTPKSHFGIDGWHAHVGVLDSRCCVSDIATGWRKEAS